MKTKFVISEYKWAYVPNGIGGGAYDWKFVKDHTVSGKEEFTNFCLQQNQVYLTSQEKVRKTKEFAEGIYNDYTVRKIWKDGGIMFKLERTQVPEVQEYRFMYLFGAWVTKETIYAETDEEAIFDADAAFKEAKTLHNWNGVALVQGNRFVKMYRPIREDDHGKLTYYNIETVNGENRKIPVDPMD